MLRKIKQWLGIQSISKDDEPWWRYIRANRFELGIFGTVRLDITVSRAKKHWVLSLALGLFWLHLRIPTTRIAETNRWGDYPQYGFYVLDGDLWVRWGLESHVFYPPWRIEHYKTQVLDQTLNWVEGNGIIKHVDVVPFVYTLRDGTTQQRVAKLTYEEWRGRPRWFKWTSVFEKINPRIIFTFDDEVGAKVGSWKGGVLGSSLPWDGKSDPIEAFKKYIATQPY